MGKLIFKYGTMSSGKTLELIAKVYHERSCGRKVIVCKPKIDNRQKDIETRAGLSIKVDKIIGNIEEKSITEHSIELFDPTIEYIKKEIPDFVFIDEAQFLQPQEVYDLNYITNIYPIDIICYGLKTDFKQKLFKGSKTLLELADDIIEIESTCKLCNKYRARKATCNMRIQDGKPVIEGNSIQLGSDDKYIAVCSKCYYNEMKINNII